MKLSIAGRDLAELAELGDALEVAVRSSTNPRLQYRFEWARNRPPLFWAPAVAALVIVVGGRRTGPAEVPAGAATSTRRRFTGEPPSGAYHYELPEVAGRWQRLGAALRTDYRSDKWGRPLTEYTHAHGAGVGAWSLGEPAEGPGYLLLRGGRLKITARGIEG